MTQGRVCVSLARRLVRTQFPQWRDLPVRSVERGGSDNRTFRLGERMIVRLPSGADYAMQVAKEQHWLPRLAPLLPLPIPAPLAIGAPIDDYPFAWSIYAWIDGEPAATAPIRDWNEFARDLAHFLAALQHVDLPDGPPPGPHNFHRGGVLVTYDAETRQAIASLEPEIDGRIVTELWDAAVATRWNRSPVWIHGDVSADNLLVRGGQLCAIIDFGMLGVGDPACDLAIAWTLLDPQSRKTFRSTLPLDADTWRRGRGWALWKALIVAAGQVGASHAGKEASRNVIAAILDERSIDG